MKSKLNHLHIVEITQSYRPFLRYLHSNQSTHSRNYLVIQTGYLIAPYGIIYTQQKLFSHIDMGFYLYSVHIYTQQKLFSHIDGIDGKDYLIIYTQQKLFSHIDTDKILNTYLIYTQQKLFSHIDLLIILPAWLHLHIVEIIQSYRQMDRVTVEDISTHSRNYLVIQTTFWQRLEQHLHIVEIIQSYRQRIRSERACESTHSRNYLVIQTNKTLNLHCNIYTQQKLFSHIDQPAPYGVRDIYTQQKLFSHIDSYCANISIYLLIIK